MGDLILTRRVRDQRDPRFLQFVELLRSADCAWGNCEMNIMDHRLGYPMGKGQDGTVICEPWGAEELAWMGIDFLGMANNHTADYGQDGVLETIKNVERAGLKYAGSGPDLQHASRPGYFDSPGGRVGQVSCASTFAPWSKAAYTTAHAKGRPGLNPLGYERTIQLESERFDQLQQVMAATEQARGGDDETDGREPSAGNELNFMGNRFVRGTVNDVLTEPHAGDLKRITDEVKIARRNTRVVFVSIHAHESYRSERDVPARFLETFARACIDAGADAFFGSGPHILRGLEVYRGKPIFYSLGNTIFQYETVNQIGVEEWDASNIDHNLLDPSLVFDKFDFPEDERVWETVVPFITFEPDSTIKEIKLYPVLMGQHEPRYWRGTPVMATPEEGEVTMNRLGRLSEPYGTEISYRDGIGYVSL
jgi:poly-gamma-glutamate synthesis protein (capsule biosynthesis protein)